MAESGLTELLGRTLVLAAHPDDEAVGCGVVLQRMKERAIAYLTDGAPQNGYFWQQYGSRENYAGIRRREAEAVAALVGAKPFFNDIPDQELFRRLESAQAWLEVVVAQFQPQAILAPSFEGGHPDHDACNLLAFVAGKEHGIAVWEYPAYHRSVDGALVHQQFPDSKGSEVALVPSASEWDRKLHLYGEYASQREVLQHFLSEVEQFRPLPAYDYEAPPLPGVLNYEAWQWGITGSEVAAAFAAHLQGKTAPAR
ncbi:MAG TPA: PIG-L family deacetylase [Terriglobales bacterium]|nr:PIG-L family deacetylase [Terriglobales bacterium]